jgi:hypothetical protein
MVGNCYCFQENGEALRSFTCVKSKYEKIREILVERYSKIKDGEIEEGPNSLSQI